MVHTGKANGAVLPVTWTASVVSVNLARQQPSSTLVPQGSGFPGKVIQPVQSMTPVGHGSLRERPCTSRQAVFGSWPSPVASVVRMFSADARTFAASVSASTLSVDFHPAVRGHSDRGPSENQHHDQ